MGLALHSAVLAAQWIQDALENNLHDVRALRAQFTRLWRGRRAACRLMGIMISHPTAARIMTLAASTGSALTSMVLRQMGKSYAKTLAD